MRALVLLVVTVSDPAADLGMELFDLTALEAPAGLRFHRARGAGPGDKAPRELTVASLVLGAPLDGARLTVAVGSEGRLVHATVVGHPEVEGDRSTAWALFLGQLCEYGALGPVDEFTRKAAATPAELSAWRTAQVDGPDGSLIEFLIEQRATMRAMTLFQRNLILAPRPLEEARLEALDARLGRLEERSAILELLLGEEGLAQWRRQLGGLRERFAGLIEVDPAEHPARARRLCGSCHTQAAPDGGDWTERLSALRSELGFPVGALVVGFDVAAAPGDDGGRSQQVADGVRTLLDAVARR